MYYIYYSRSNKFGTAASRSWVGSDEFKSSSKKKFEYIDGIHQNLVVMFILAIQTWDSSDGRTKTLQMSTCSLAAGELWLWGNFYQNDHCLIW